MSKYMTVTEFRNKALATVKQAERTGESFIITTRGKPAAILMSFDDWESIVETMAIQSDPELMKQIKEGQEYFANGGKGVSIDEIDWS